MMMYMEALLVQMCTHLTYITDVDYSYLFLGRSSCRSSFSSSIFSIPFVEALHLHAYLEL